jgi:hypothetical protein
MFASLIAGVVTGETLAIVRRARRAAIAYGMAGLLAAMGFFFLIVAAAIYAAQRLGAIEACLVFGGGFLALALLVIIVHAIASRTRGRAAVRQRNRDLVKVAAATGLAVLPALMRGRGPLVLIAPAVAAVAYMIYRENAGPNTPGDDL